MKSIGVGGHIERTKDKSIEESYEYSMWRELEEEIGLNKSYVKSNKIIGIINDDSDSVGRVHLGIVHHIKVNSTDFINNIENKLSNAGWEFTGYLNKGISGWENWSFFVINDLLKQLKNK
jgi:predicted NUDIX family phosphoesterase